MSLSEHLPAAFDPSGWKTGRNPIATDPRDLHVGDYLIDPSSIEKSSHFGLSSARVPAEVHQSHYEFAWPMLGNDTWGDCVAAAMLHLDQAWHLHRQDTPPAYTTEQALSVYSSLTGFDINAGPSGSNPTDQGADPNAALKYWRGAAGKINPVLKSHPLGAYAQVDMLSADLVQRCVYEFGGIFLCVDLPDNWQDAVQNGVVWDVPSTGPAGRAAPNPSNGHAIVLVSYSLPENLLAVLSWGHIFLVTYRWLGTYQVQGNVLVSKDQLNAKGLTETGFDLSMLADDAHLVTAA